MDRQRAYDTIVNTLYGAPGERHDTPIGTDLAMGMLREMGLAALTDDAVIRLAQMHEAQERIETRSGRRRT